MLLFVLNVNSAGLRTRACAFNLQVPYPRSNSGKRTFAYSAATLFNCLDTDLKQIACVSPSSIIFSSRLNNFKHKLFILFLKFASNVISVSFKGKRIQTKEYAFSIKDTIIRLHA